MPKLIFLLNFLLVSQIVSAQDEPKKFKFPINEFRASVNRTALQDQTYKEYYPNDIENRVGFGVGVYRSGSTEKRVNFIAGLEFNHTRQYRKQFWMKQYDYMLETTYTISCFSVPLGLRFNIGDKIKFFIEPGVYVDYLSASRMKGVRQHEINPDGSVANEYMDKNAYLNKVNYGFYSGIGTTIPRGKISFLIKADYKYGIVDLNPDANNVYYQGYSRLYNRYLSLSLGVKF